MARSWSSCVAFIVAPLFGSQTHVTGIVPQLNHRLRPSVLVAERAQALRPEIEIAAGSGLEAKPARAHHAQNVSAREDQHIALDGPRRAHHPVGPRPHLLRRLPAGTAVAEQD